MNFSLFLLEFLKKHNRVSLPGFGTFYLHTINAVLDKEGKNILPPGAEVAFKTEISENGNDFVHYLSEEKNIPVVDAEIEIKKHISIFTKNFLIFFVFILIICSIFSYFLPFFTIFAYF